MVDAEEHRSPGEENFERWEAELIERVAGSHGTLDREDLAAELAWRLLILKRQPKPEIRNWRAYVFKFLRNKALNWIRRTRPRERMTVSLDAPIEEGSGSAFSLADLIASPEADVDRRLAIEQTLDELPAELRMLLKLLVDERWNQIAVGRRLRKHRNTIRAWINRIRQAFIANGLALELGSERPSVSGAQSADVGRAAPSPERPEFVTIPISITDAMTKRGFSGTQWRLLLWVVSQIFRRKQRTVRLNWHWAAREIAADHAAVGRAGKLLSRAGVLFIDRGRIGIRRDIRRWTPVCRN